MKRILLVIGLAAGMAVVTSGAAQAPAGSSGECKDGTYTDAKSKSGACAGHGGVKEWYAAKSKGEAKPAKEPAAAKTAAAAPAGSTGECKDGTYTDSPSKSGACAGHGGVKEWYGAKSNQKTEAKASKEPAAAKTATAAPAAAAPAGSTGSCKDGTYTEAKSKSGACAGHGGVKEWYGAKATGAAATAAGGAAAGGAAATAAPARPTSTTEAAPRQAAAPGGGAGRVWVNPSSKVYHCAGDEWYGKTKTGEYMSESAARAQGNRPSGGKDCG